MRNLSATEVVEAERDDGELDLDDHMRFRVEETATMPQGAHLTATHFEIITLPFGSSTIGPPTLYAEYKCRQEL